jgi:hypothetical protein
MVHSFSARFFKNETGDDGKVKVYRHHCFRWDVSLQLVVARATQENDVLVVLSPPKHALGEDVVTSQCPDSLTCRAPTMMFVWHVLLPHFAPLLKPIAPLTVTTVPKEKHIDVPLTPPTLAVDAT